MGLAVARLLILAAFSRGAPQQDTLTYADRATSDLVARAMVRHRMQDTTVRDYQASVRYRLSFSLGKRKWAQLPVAAVEEQAGTIAWQLPNDLRVDMLGRRQASRLEGVDMNSSFDRPWFVPRTLGDSIRVFGSDEPTRGAPHPLAPGADRHYRYAAGDSLIIAAGTRRVTIRSITITPKSAAGAFVAGMLWVDVATGDVVRFTFRFVGAELWNVPDGETRQDTIDARRVNKLVSRILQLDADLEYGLQEDKHWMPYRQVISGRITIPLGVDIAVPFEAATTFDDYTINTGRVVVFDAPFADTTVKRSREEKQAARDTLRAQRQEGTTPDSLRARNRTGYLAGGGRYQIHRPPVDSLKNYAGWSDSLTLDQSDADRQRIREATSELAALAEGLPPEMTGGTGMGIGLERAADLLRHNRVQGLTLSLPGRTRAPIAYTDLFGTLRYGFADSRLMARVAAVRDAPSGRLTVAVSRDLADMDVFARGLSLGNSLNSMLAGHDDGAYLLAQGGRITHEMSAGLATEVTLGAIVEDQRSVAPEARALLPQIFGATGYYPPNPAIREGFATGISARLDHGAFGARWMLSGDALHVAGRAAGRMVGELRLNSLAGGWLSARVKGGVATGVDSIPQLALRAGGVNTVRGYDYGVQQGDAMWAAQLDVRRPGRGAVKVVFFVDAGQAGQLASFGEAEFLSSAGVGVSFLGGFIRTNLSYPLTYQEGHGVRFDLVFGGLR